MLPFFPQASAEDKKIVMRGERVGHKTLNIPQEMGTPDHLSCLLRNLYVGQKQQLEQDMEQ